MKRPTVLLLALALCGCTHVQAKNNITGRIDERPKIQHPAVAVLVSPINLGPNIISNYAAGLYPGDLWPIQYSLWPLSGLLWGIQDAVLGYPFWSPSAIYE